MNNNGMFKLFDSTLKMNFEYFVCKNRLKYISEQHKNINFLIYLQVKSKKLKLINGLSVQFQLKLIIYSQLLKKIKIKKKYQKQKQNFSQKAHMSLTQQFLQQNLNKQLSSSLLEQIQNSNSAIQNLIGNLEGLRTNKHHQQILRNKINRIENYLEVKKLILSQLHGYQSGNCIFQWLLDALINNPMLYEIIKNQEFMIQKQLINIAKKTLFEREYQKYHLQDIQTGNSLAKQLQLLNQNKFSALKALSRQKIKEIDISLQVFQNKIKKLQQNVENFNFQILHFLKKVYNFEEKIKNQFISYFSSNIENQYQENLQKSTLQDNVNSRNHSQKSRLSINSQQNDLKMKSSIKAQFFQNQLTPRKKLQTQACERKKQQVKRTSIVSYKASQFQDKKLSIDAFKNMNKTLSNFNFYHPEQNPLYTVTDFGGHVRLPTQWTNKNTRSSISYYPPR